MKRKVIFAMLVLVISSLANLTASAQGVIVYKTDGTKIKVPYTQLDSIATYTYEEGQDETEDNAEVKEYMVGKVSFKMIRVQAGTFRMGSTSGKTDEQSVHSVTLSSDYYIGETEVTQELWTAVMGINPSYYCTDDSRLPVDCVSWDDCQRFITKLNSLTGVKFRLPTEAEWEFAARGGNKSKDYIYSGSNNIDDVKAGYAFGPTVVKTKLPNELGIYDMTGNVSEWCSDWYGGYSSAAVTDPQGASSGSERVYRGGSWNNSDYGCRCTFRFSYTPSTKALDLGLRLVSQ